MSQESSIEESETGRRILESVGRKLRVSMRMAQVESLKSCVGDSSFKSKQCKIKCLPIIKHDYLIYH